MPRLFISAFTAFCVLVTLIVAVDAAEPFRDFTFKRIKPPKAGTKTFITIQVENPVDQIATPADQPQPQTPLSNDWFWNEISPDITSAGPGRFAAAVKHLQNAPTGQGPIAPRLQAMRNVARDHGTAILIATVGKKISPAFVLAVIGAESSGDAQAQSDKGALGLMQLIPETAARFNVADPLDPVQNISGGVAYLAWLLKKFDGDPILALAGYNAGENAVIKNAGVPPFPETRTYVPKVLAAWQVARALCITPPELFSDGCVFNIKDSE